MAIINPLPFNLLNGTITDAAQVMADFNEVRNDVNANAAPLASPTFTGSPIVPGYAPLVSPALTGTATAVNLTTSGAVNLNGAPNNIKGITDGSNAAAGYVGEYLQANGTASFASNVITSIVGLSLTAGDWDAWGFVQFTSFVSNATAIYAGVGTTQNNLGPYAVGIALATANIAAFTYLHATTVRFNLTSTTTAYITAQAAFASGSCNTAGWVFARRVR